MVSLAFVLCLFSSFSSCNITCLFFFISSFSPLCLSTLFSFLQLLLFLFLFFVISIYSLLCVFFLAHVILAYHSWVFSFLLFSLASCKFVSYATTTFGFATSFARTNALLVDSNLNLIATIFLVSICLWFNRKMVLCCAWLIVAHQLPEPCS